MENTVYFAPKSSKGSSSVTLTFYNTAHFADTKIWWMNYLNTHLLTKSSKDSFGGGIQTSLCYGLTDIWDYFMSADSNPSNVYNIKY